MRVLMIVLTLFISVSILEASVEVKKFKNQQQEQRYKNLINELRCLVCQNQNLAGSDAGLAQDLRKQVYKMINAGQSDKEILEFMVTRYGDFVLYRPPFKATTFFLWIGPFIILAIGLFALIRFIVQRKKVLITKLTDNDKEKIKQLLDQDKEQIK
jgi:cytochrome c-type biogenesis protein CcmH